MTMDRKTIVSLLDSAAQRADMVGAEPATSKQCWYLSGLMVNDNAWRADQYLESNAMLSKRQASALIDSILKSN